MKNTIVKTLQKDIPALQLIYLFGSEAQETAGRESDVDVAFLAAETVDNVERFSIAQELAVKLGKSVDLVDLSRSSEVFNMQVIAKGECLLNNDNSGFEDSVFYKYIDLNEQRSLIIDDIKRTGTVYG